MNKTGKSQRADQNTEYNKCDSFIKRGMHINEKYLLNSVYELFQKEVYNSEKFTQYGVLLN